MSNLTKKKQALNKKKKSNKKIRNEKLESKRPISKFLLIGFLVVLIAAISAVILLNLFPSDSGKLTIVYPFDKSLFPPEIISPRILWKDLNPDVEKWKIVIEFEDKQNKVSVEVDTTEWTPEQDVWETIKKRSLEKKAVLTVKSMGSVAGITKTLASQTISISTSKDSVDAPIYYRDVPLPFSVALKNVDKIKWRLGDISSYDRPPVVLTNLPVCGNCHSFSSDGKTLGMDVDIGNDKGAYVLTSFEEETIFSRDRLISWTKFVRDEKVPTFGMLPRVSPDGQYVLSGVKDRSVFLPRRDILFSQIFFPVMGILAYYDKQTKNIHALPGADNEAFVQANGSWTPDGKEVVFSRNQAAKLTAKSDHVKGIILNKAESIEVLGGEEYLEKPQESPKTFAYDLYKVPFNDGKGGKPVPIVGASENGMSNYFPKFSPDGKWLVFTQAHSYMLLQPDSKLYIMPAEGGEPRLMNCNTNRMNSWHAWSPNSKWLVFSSKVFSPNTQLFLTHIDENGNDTPPILLRNFTPLDEERGANIPEFVNMKPGDKRIIHERFLDDYNYFRSGQIYEQFREYGRAEEEYLKSLKINPKSKVSHYFLGALYAKQEDYEKAKSEFETALRLDPENSMIRKDLAVLYYNMKEYDKAESEFKKLIQIDPNNMDAHYNLGSVYYEKREFNKAENKFKAVLKEDIDHEKMIGAHFNLGHLYITKKQYQKAKIEFETILNLDSENVDAHHNLGNIFTILKEEEKAKQEYIAVIKIDPKNVSAHLELAELCVKTNDNANAIKEFKTVLELEPTNLYSQIYLGRIYTSLRDFDNATKEFTTILKRDPNNTYAHINMGKMYMAMEDYDQAIFEFKRVLELNPKDAVACFLLSQIFDEKKKNTEEAIFYLEKGLKINPTYFDGRIRLGNLHLKKGEVTRAIEQLKMAFRLNSKAPGLKEKIEELKKRL